MKLLYTISFAGLFLVACNANTANEEVTSTNPIIENTISEIETVTETEPEVIQQIAEDVSAEKFQEILASKEVMLIDVRTAEEYANGSIKNAKNLDFNRATFKENLGSIDREKVICVYCHSGRRSGETLTILEEMGFNESYNLIGGYSAWPYK